MIENYLCEACDKNAVCKIMDILSKFDIETKKPLGVDIKIKKCLNYEYEEGSDEIKYEGTEE